MHPAPCPHVDKMYSIPLTCAFKSSVNGKFTPHSSHGRVLSDALAIIALLFLSTSSLVSAFETYLLFSTDCVVSPFTGQLSVTRAIVRAFDQYNRHMNVSEVALRQSIYTIYLEIHVICHISICSPFVRLAPFAQRTYHFSDCFRHRVLPLKPNRSERTMDRCWI